MCINVINSSGSLEGVEDMEGVEGVEGVEGMEGMGGVEDALWEPCDLYDPYANKHTEAMLPTAACCRSLGHT